MGYKHNATDIIATGAELIRKKGYHHVGINEILKTADIPKGSFYNFFESKEDFARQILEVYGERSLNMMTGFLTNKELSPLNRLKSFYSFLIDSNEADGLDAGCLIASLSMEVGAYNDVIATAANNGFTSWLQVIGECIREGQSIGEINNEHPAEDLAEFMHAGIYGAFTRMKVNRDRVYLDKWYRMSFALLEKVG